MLLHMWTPGIYPYVTDALSADHIRRHFESKCKTAKSVITYKKAEWAGEVVSSCQSIWLFPGGSVHHFRLGTKQTRKSICRKEPFLHFCPEL